MKYFFSITLFAVLFFTCSSLSAQIKRVDTTLLIGKVGFRILCNNRDTANNELNIRPVGFDHDARERATFMKGRIYKSEIDDLNNDGFPDLMLYVALGASGIYRTAYVIVSIANKSFTIAGLPDVQLDAKYKDGYRGYDEFSLLEGTLIRKFPVYKPEDTNISTGGKRIILYELTGSEETGFKLKPKQSYETK